MGNEFDCYFISFVFSNFYFITTNRRCLSGKKKKVTTNILDRDPVTLREEDLGKPCIWLAFIQTASRCFSKGTLAA